MPDRGHFLFIIDQIHQSHAIGLNMSPDRKFARSRRTVHFSEQIMLVDKYPSIFSRLTEALVYILVYHGKSLPPDPSPKFPQFTPPPVLTNLSPSTADNVDLTESLLDNWLKNNHITLDKIYYLRSLFAFFFTNFSFQSYFSTAENRHKNRILWQLAKISDLSE